MMWLRIVGFVLYFGIFYFILRMCVRVYKGSGGMESLERDLVIGVIAMLVAFFCNGAVQ